MSARENFLLHTLQLWQFEAIGLEVLQPGLPPTPLSSSALPEKKSLVWVNFVTWSTCARKLIPTVWTKAKEGQLFGQLLLHMYIILAPKTTALKTKSGFERLLIYISKYMLIIMHIILKWQSTSKVFKNEWKLITLVWGWVNYYKQVTEKLIYSDKNKPKQTKLASKCIFSEIKKTFGLSHFKIMCIVINMKINV